MNERAFRSGSNIEAFPSLTETLQRAAKRRYAGMAETFRALQQQKKPLASNRAAMKAMDAAIAEERRVFDAGVLASRGNRAQITKLKATTRRKIQKRLASFPKARAIAALNKAHAVESTRAFARLGGLFDDRVRADLVLGLPEIDYDTFQPPFELYGLHSDPFEANQPSVPHEIDDYIIYNGSFVIPAWGVMGNDFTFRHSHSSWLHPSSFQQRSNIALLGINYRMPRTGRLNVSAVAQNLSNSLTLALTDNFGFSKGDVDATQSLYIIIVRPRGALFDLAYLDTVQEQLISGGDDVSHSVSNLQTTVPYTVNFSSSEAYNEGDELPILIGTNVHVGSYLEFMNSRIDATFVWLLKAIYVSVS